MKCQTLIQSFRWLELPLLLGLLLVIFCSGIEKVSFHSDESQWIAKSSSFEAFIRGDFNSSIWNESYWNLTQPQFARYIIALGRLTGGYHADDLNQPWDHGLSEAVNISAGNMPSLELLWWSRLPMAILAALSGLLIFTIVCASANRLAGYLFLFLFAGNPFILTVLRHAMGESPLLGSLTLMTAASIQAVSSWGRISMSTPMFSRSFLQPFAWFMLMGLGCGTAGSAKLNGLSAIGLGPVLGMLSVFTNTNNVSWLKRFIVSACVSLLFLLAVGWSFVAWNPYLYPDPLWRTDKMFRNRLYEMRVQQEAFGSQRIQGLGTRIQIVSRRIFNDYTAMRFPGAKILNMLLCTAGLYYVARHVWHWFHGGEAHPASVVILLMALATGVPSLFTPLDWDRYYLLPVVFCTVFSAMGLAWGIITLTSMIQHNKSQMLFRDMKRTKNIGTH